MIRAHNLKKAFATQEEKVSALNGIGFDVESGSFFTLLGPSGCGKTTTLRCIAGLERPDEGEIAIGDRTVFSSSQRIFIPGNKRDIGMVFQSYAIWPHMTVYGNVAYPLRARGRPRAEIEEKVHAALKLVGLEDFHDRLAPRLSGGQQQRVALARALVAEPSVLLLDEPLSNLDAKLRNQMRWELKDLQRRLGTTTIYVTHDQVEALAISDRIALMNKGQIAQIGTPREIYANPVNEFAADFIGAANIISGELSEEIDHRSFARITTSFGVLMATQKGELNKASKDVLIAFRPEDVSLVSQATCAEGQHNVFQGIVQGSTYLGDSSEFRITVGEQRIQAKTDSTTHFPVGAVVYLSIAPAACLVIRRGD
ncbi:MAG: ABC transporter ATP-binding protein [Deltaproteobacteria bacterium]|nr:ABC transporter ATP-binding protein [Deltaproteobacteria bacterium]